MTLMRRLLWLWAAIAVFAAEEAKRPADHVILISIDGLRPDFYRDASWPAPNLQRMAAEGVSADRVRGVFPSVTYPSHTTMITGAKPARHGIYYNSPFEPGGQTGAWYWHEKDITTTTLWDAAKEAGLISLSFSWPVSVGAPVTFNVPEIWALEPVDNYYRWLRQYEQPEGLIDEIEEHATGQWTDSAFAVESLVRDLRVALGTAYLFEAFRPNLTTVHLLQTDFAQHEDGRDGPRVRQTLANADVCVGVIWEAVERAKLAERTALIITGDHGFVNINSTLAPNVWLVKAGLRGPGRDRGDWRATFHTTGASAFLILREPGDTAALDEARRVLAELPASRKRLFRVVETEELRRIGGPADAALGLTPTPGVTITSGVYDNDLSYSSRKGQHGYLPDFDRIHTGFIGYGSGFRPGLKVDMIGLEDIAPMAAHLLGLTMETPDGALHPGFFVRPERRR